MKKAPIPLVLLTIAIAIGNFSCTDSELSSPEENNATQPTYEDLKNLDVGRLLFYDPQLSANNSVSCASCHKQRVAFADDNALSIGYDGRVTKRNSMSVQSASRMLQSRGNVKLFWDGREDNLQEMLLRPIANHVEMGMPSMDYLVEKLKRTEYYPKLFEDYYSDGEITAERISYFIARFLNRMSRQNSKFDRGEFSALELYGRELFITKYPCNDCHIITRPLAYYGNDDTTSTSFANIGLDVTNGDKGRGAITNRSEDDGKFQVPSLRNVSVTGPYMHDGRYETLEEVIEHYSTQMEANPNLDPKLRDENGNPLVLNISESEKMALVAFLNTLTDHGFLTDPYFSDPFN